MSLDLKRNHRRTTAPKLSARDRRKCTPVSKPETRLLKVAERVLQSSRASDAVRNKQYYWEALAVGVVGKLTNNRDDIRWGKDVFAYAMDQLQTDGTLPYEMARGAQALH